MMAFSVESGREESVALKLNPSKIVSINMRKV
jgi:hypothetical protein